jgi:hypothetical protein
MIDAGELRASASEGLAQSTNWRYALPSGTFEVLSDPSDDSVLVVVTRHNKDQATLHYLDADTASENGVFDERYTMLNKDYDLADDQDGCWALANYLQDNEVPLSEQSLDVLNDRYYHLTGEDLNLGE